MKAMISTVKYNQATKFLQNLLFFRNIKFCIEKLAFGRCPTKVTLIMKKNNLFLGVFPLVLFSPIDLVSADSPRKFYFLSSPL